MSRDAAYARRRAASGRAFALAWDAARLLARAPVADEAMSRAINGVVDRVYRNGELVAERHRYDNRLTMAVLTRLDRLAESGVASGPRSGRPPTSSSSCSTCCRAATGRRGVPRAAPWRRPA